MSVTGRSPSGPVPPSRFVHVAVRAVPVDPEDVARLRGRVEVVARVRDPGAVRVRRVDVDPGDEAAGVVRRRGRVDPRPRDADAAGAFAFVETNSAAGVRRDPDRPRVARGARDPRDEAACAVGPYRRRAVRSVAPAGPMRTKSPHVGLAADGRELGAVRLEERRSPPQFCVRQTLCEPWKIDLPRRVRVGDDRRVEVRALRARRRSAR